MLTAQRRIEIIKACDELIKSPNITEIGKLEAKAKREEMLRQLAILGI